MSDTNPVGIRTRTWAVLEVMSGRASVGEMAARLGVSALDLLGWMELFQSRAETSLRSGFRTSPAGTIVIDSCSCEHGMLTIEGEVDPDDDETVVGFHVVIQPASDPAPSSAPSGSPNVDATDFPIEISSDGSGPQKAFVWAVFEKIETTQSASPRAQCSFECTDGGT